MKFPSDITASCRCSYGQRGPSFLNMNGEIGYLQMDPASYYEGGHLRGEAAGQPVDVLSPGKHPFQFGLEAEHFTDRVRNNKEPKSPGEEGLKDMIAIEEIHKAASAPIA
jgi:predicted dehydrogenase